MNPLDSRTHIELVLEQVKKWMDSLKIACVTLKGHNEIDGTDSARLYSAIDAEIAVCCYCLLFTRPRGVKQVQKRRPRTSN